MVLMTDFESSCIQGVRNLAMPSSSMGPLMCWHSFFYQQMLLRKFTAFRKYRQYQGWAFCIAIYRESNILHRLETPENIAIPSDIAIFFYAWYWPILAFHGPVNNCNSLIKLCIYICELQLAFLCCCISFAMD